MSYNGTHSHSNCVFMCCQLQDQKLQFVSAKKYKQNLSYYVRLDTAESKQTQQDPDEYEEEINKFKY